MINRDRPNTGLTDDLLHPNVILCCGEDWQELLTALGSITGESPTLYHEYRCYRVAKFTGFSLIWSGMGTGCLEPLLFELRGSAIIQSIVLIGTAGATSAVQIRLGDLYIVHEAFLGGTAIRLPSCDPHEPHFAEDLLAETKLAKARIVSTDYYYGFSSNEDSKELRAADPSLAAAVSDYLGNVQLVDMETAQFYYFCRTLFSEDLNYVSLKGAANSLSQQTLQTVHSFDILRKALLASFTMFKLQPQPLVAGVAVKLPKDEAMFSKLMEEVKLFWTIQIAVCGVLGYLGTNLVLVVPKLAEGSVEIASLHLKNLCLCGVSLFLIQIGAMYNVVGNYYARMAASGTLLFRHQENRIAPTLAAFYLIISGAVAALGVKTGFRGPENDWWLVVAALGGLAMNYIICRKFVYGALKNNADYRDYAAPLCMVYDCIAGLAVVVVAKLWLATKCPFC